MSSGSNIDLYARAGIEDVAEFYRTKFVSNEILDARYFTPVDRFDIRFARTMWVYDNVRAGSCVLDLGCGAGMLAVLKRKGVTLVGVDISAECSVAARRNGYDATYLAELTRLPFADASFDYTVSLDVLGHVTFEEKDAVLAEIKRVLRPRGVTMHGIECRSPLYHKAYDEMTREELRRFITVDGHVGLEEETEHAARFRRFFSHVAYEPRYTLCLSSEEFLKQADEYDLPFEQDFLHYLRGLSFRERRAFDIAMGYVFGRISDLKIKLPPSGLYIFLKASEEPLGVFYNEHRDRSALEGGAPKTATGAKAESVCLDRHPAAIFDDGWYEANNLPPVARWMRKRGCVRFPGINLKKLSLDLTTHIPNLIPHGLELELLLNGACVSRFTLFRYGWLQLEISLPPESGRATNGTYELEIRASRTWQPRPHGENRDDRDLSIAVCNIEAAMDLE